MKITADACLNLTLGWASSRLRPDDSEALDKLMRLYGDLRVKEHLSETGNPAPTQSAARQS